jgi:hypothetical protein
MTYEEKQLPVKIKNKWFQTIYTYETEAMEGHPISKSNDEVTEAYVQANYPELLESKKSVIIDRNVIVMIFASLDKLTELDAWLNSSKTVESYFSTETISVDDAGFQVILAMINQGVSSNILSSEVGQALISALSGK